MDWFRLLWDQFSICNKPQKHDSFQRYWTYVSPRFLRSRIFVSTPDSISFSIVSVMVREKQNQTYKIGFFQSGQYMFIMQVVHLQGSVRCTHSGIWRDFFKGLKFFWLFNFKGIREWIFPLSTLLVRNKFSQAFVV